LKQSKIASKNVILFSFTLSVFASYGQQKPNLVLTSRWFHPRNHLDSISTVEAIEVFKPSRIDWTYEKDSANTKIYSQLALPYSLTINPMVPDSGFYTTKKWRIHDINGETYVMPWLIDKTIKTPYWGCVNNPEFEALFSNKTKELLLLNPYAIMVDNADFNYQLVIEKKIGCFCDPCINEFTKEHPALKMSTPNLLDHFRSVLGKGASNKDSLSKMYSSFQQKTVTLFLQRWKDEMLAINPKLVFLTNNYNGHWSSHLRIFDGGIAELNEKMITEKNLDSLYKMADELGKTQLFNSNSAEDYYHEFLLDYTLKNKRETLIPWDLYILKSSKRYYMKYSTFENIFSNY
jgi:hypothetical protein